jgi:CRISPR-associated endonuclease/helicase Cas3
VALTERGEADLIPLQALLARGQSALAFCTIVLPVEAGGLTHEGLLDGAVKEPAIDVAETAGKRAREIIRGVEGTYWDWPINDYKAGKSSLDHLDDGQACTSIEKAAAQIAQTGSMVVSQLLPLVLLSEGEEDEAESRSLLLLVEPKKAVDETPESSGFVAPPTLDEHSQQAAAWAESIADVLCLEEFQKQALITAARWHDQGKNRKCWQRAIFNATDVVLAKPMLGGMNPRILGGYRHEFGSLLEAAGCYGWSDL